MKEIVLKGLIESVAGAKTQGPGGGSDPGNIAVDHGANIRMPRRDVGGDLQKVVRATTVVLTSACLKSKNPGVCQVAAASSLVDSVVNFDW